MALGQIRRDCSEFDPLKCERPVREVAAKKRTSRGSYHALALALTNESQFIVNRHFMPRWGGPELEKINSSNNHVF